MPKGEYREVDCSNPDCPNKIHVIKKSGNSTGRQEYCSIKCFHAFSPRKIAVVQRWHPGVSAVDMKDKFVDIVKYINVQFASDSERAQALGVSRSAFRQWRNEVIKPS